MTDEPITRPYRVTFLNLHNGVRHVVTVSAPMEGLARKGADVALADHVAKTAGHVSDWAHYSTVEVSA